MYVEELLDALPIPWLHGLGGGYLMAIEFTLGFTAMFVLLLIVLSVLLPRNNNMGKRERRKTLLTIGSDIMVDGVEAHIHHGLITREEGQWIYDKFGYGLGLKDLLPGRPNTLTQKLLILERIGELKKQKPIRFPDSDPKVVSKGRTISEILDDLTRKRKV